MPNCCWAAAGVLSAGLLKSRAAACAANGPIATAKVATAKARRGLIPEQDLPSPIPMLNLVRGPGKCASSSPRCRVPHDLTRSDLGFITLAQQSDLALSSGKSQEEVRHM